MFRGAGKVKSDRPPAERRCVGGIVVCGWSTGVGRDHMPSGDGTDRNRQQRKLASTSIALVSVRLRLALCRLSAVCTAVCTGVIGHLISFPLIQSIFDSARPLAHVVPKGGTALIKGGSAVQARGWVVEHGSGGPVRPGWSVRPMGLSGRGARPRISPQGLVL